MNVQVTKHSPGALVSPACSLGVSGLIIQRRGTAGQLLWDTGGLQVADANRWRPSRWEESRAWLEVALLFVSQVPPEVSAPGIYLEGVRSLDLIHFFLVQSDGFWRLDFKVFSIKNSSPRVEFGFNPSPSSRWFFCLTGAPASAGSAAPAGGTLMAP